MGLSRHVSTRHVQRVEPMHFCCVELVEQHSSTHSSRRSRHVERVVSCRDVTRRAKWNLALFHGSTLTADFHNTVLSDLTHRYSVANSDTGNILFRTSPRNSKSSTRHTQEMHGNEKIASSIGVRLCGLFGSLPWIICVSYQWRRLHIGHVGKCTQGPTFTNDLVRGGRAEEQQTKKLTKTVLSITKTLAKTTCRAKKVEGHDVYAPCTFKIRSGAAVTTNVEHIGLCSWRIFLSR